MQYSNTIPSKLRLRACGNLFKLLQILFVGIYCCIVFTRFISKFNKFYLNGDYNKQHILKPHQFIYFLFELSYYSNININSIILINI